MNCFDKYKCKGMCCYDGVYLTKDDMERINTCAQKYPKYFSATDFYEISDWKNLKGLIKTKTKPNLNWGENFPKHFNQTSCIFQLEDGRCLLEKIAIENGEHRWAYKPTSCYLFPLRLKNGKIKCPIKNKEDDENLFDDYPGYESCLPCFQKFNNYKKELKDEIEHYKKSLSK